MWFINRLPEVERGGGRNSSLKNMKVSNRNIAARPRSQSSYHWPQPQKPRIQSRALIKIVCRGTFVSLKATCSLAERSKNMPHSHCPAEGTSLRAPCRTKRLCQAATALPTAQCCRSAARRWQDEPWKSFRTWQQARVSSEESRNWGGLRPLYTIKNICFADFSLMFSVTVNLVKLHSFVFIHSRQDIPKSSGVRAISEQGSHSHLPVLICATATSQMRQLQYPQNYLWALLS